MLDAGAALRPADGPTLDPMVQPQCSLAVQLRRATGAIIGRAAELAAISQELKDAGTRFAAMTLEGEPGLGKTRLLVAAAELASAAGFCTVAVTADEEIRGPFLVARSIFAAPAIRDTAAGTAAEVLVRRATDAISGRDEPGYESLSAEARQLRAFDLAAIALGALARIRPLALLIDDVQWADDDTLRLLRYAVRSDADLPIFLFLTIRPDEFAAVAEAVNFVADMERMGLVRRLRPERFNPIETAELVRNVLGGTVDGPSAAALHAQSEGVPFIVEELARAHRDAGTLRQVDGEWRLGRNAARLVPSAVRTLISRRAAHLPAITRAAMADAALLGRSFSLRDLRAIRAQVGAPDDAAGAAAAAAAATAATAGHADLAEDLQPAVAAGLLLQHPETDAADYTFPHEQVREFSSSQLSQARRRKLHAALVELLLSGGDPSPAGLPMLAQHALAAGLTERAARFSIDAAAAALHSNAPEEALRLVDQALPVVSAPSDRRVLLLCRDDAYAALRRSSDRLDGLTELAALAEALRDTSLELDVRLRRAAALRIAHDEDAAAELARRVRTRAAELGDARAELRANIELGQALMKSPMGEGFGGVSSEVDLTGGEEAYRRAIELAEQIGDDRMLAGALREVGTVAAARLRDWLAAGAAAGRGFELGRRFANGESAESIMASLPIAPLAAEANQLYERALGIYERLDDRTGVMSTVIAMAYINYAPLIHLTSSARHLEEIRRVTGRLWDLVTESERARMELQMLFGVHVYARAKVVPDLMLSRGEDAWRAAKLLGDQAIEFASAGGVALSHLDLGDVAEAERWLGLAAAVSGAAPTNVRTRQLETWRGMARGAAGDAAGMRRHLEQAVALATGQGRAAARCESLARLALEAARLGATTHDEELLMLASRSAVEAKELAAHLPGHAPWSPQADAAMSEIALARGDVPGAVAAAGSAIASLLAALREDVYLEIVLPAGRAMLAGGPPEARGLVREYLQISLSKIAQGTLDEAIRVRWLRGPLGRQLVELAGDLGDTVVTPTGAAVSATEAGAGLDSVDRRLLKLLTEGSTNREMAAELGETETAISQRLAGLLARMGASTRAEATSLAFRGFGQ